MIAGVVLTIGLIWAGLSNKFTDQSASSPEKSRITGPTIYVVSFEAVTASVDEQHLSKGISVEIVNVLSQFVELQVYPVGPAFRASAPANEKQSPKNSELQFVLSGSVQMMGEGLRITARLQSARDGLQVWSKRYDGAFSPDQIFDFQESIATNVAKKLAEPYGLLRKFSRRHLKNRQDPSLDTYKCVLLAYEYRQKFSAELHQRARACLERATQTDPDYARAWALLAHLVVDEYRAFFNVRPNTLARAIGAARRAVELSPEDVLSHQALSVALFSNGEIDKSLEAAMKAVSLNPHNKEALAQLGMRTAFSGNWKEGFALAQKAIAESPAVPSWYHWVPALYHYQRQDYKAAQIAVEQIGLNDTALIEATRAMIYGQLGMQEEATNAITNCRRLDPEFNRRAREWFAVHKFDDGVLDHFMAGLYKAGLTRQ